MHGRDERPYARACIPLDMRPACARIDVVNAKAEVGMLPPTQDAATIVDAIIRAST